MVAFLWTLMKAIMDGSQNKNGTRRTWIEKWNTDDTAAGTDDHSYFYCR